MTMMDKPEQVLSDKIKKAITAYLKKQKMPNHKFIEFKVTAYPEEFKISSEFLIKVDIDTN